ncbi:hypothetical protein ABVK25_010054 [Lepraria finkii]|uniref:Uncharacterized protein n=1 Tax=Lepraria finkii TaxID=1340010 RepID=A0ABR4AX65_9LECA
MKRPPRWSARSFTVCAVWWSCLSGLSLADVSVISVISLPISAGELWNGQRYSNLFAASKGALEGITEEYHCVRTVSRQGFESSQDSDWRTRTESRMGSISRLGSISPSSNPDAAKGKFSYFQTVKKLLRTRDESPNREGSRTPSISIGESGISIAVLPRKIALIGASLSRNTTIYNHLQILHSKNFSKTDRFDARRWVVSDSSMPPRWLKMIWSSYKWTVVLNRKMRRCVSSNNRVEVKGIDAYATSYSWTIWNIFFTSQDLVPDELLLRSHAETTRVDEVSLKIDHTGCQILDVGGLRLERDKWAQCIKGVDNPVFVVSLTGYCQPRDEDPEPNQMEESLTLFEQMAKLEELKTVAILLSLNKVDIFKSKTLTTPICDTFSAYSGSLGCVTACIFFVDGIMKRDERPNGILRICVTSAVDPKTSAGTLDSEALLGER